MKIEYIEKTKPALMEHKEQDAIVKKTIKQNNLEIEWEGIDSVSPAEKFLIIRYMQTPKEYIKERVLFSGVNDEPGDTLMYVEANYILQWLNFFFPDSWSYETVSIKETKNRIITSGKITIDCTTFVDVGGEEKMISTKAIRFGTGISYINGDNDYKASETDALKKAASRFGFASDVYSGEYSTKGNTEDNEVIKIANKKNGKHVPEKMSIPGPGNEQLEITNQLPIHIANSPEIEIKSASETTKENPAGVPTEKMKKAVERVSSINGFKLI